MFLRTVSQGNRAYCWKITPRSIPGPTIGCVVHGHRARVIRLQACQDVQQGGLAAAGWPDDGDEFVFVDIQVDIQEGDDITTDALVGFVDILDFNQ